MSSGCGDVLSLEDLKTAKKHQLFEAEVITGKQGGLATGAEIDYATNQVTGQVQKTLPAILRDAGFQPASFDFITGGTLDVNDRNKVVYDPVSKTWYSYAGTLPVIVPAGFNPVGNVNWKPQTDPKLREELTGSTGATLIGYKKSNMPSVRYLMDFITDSGLSITDFGADPTGVIPCDTAIEQAQLYSKTIKFPSNGKFLITRPIKFYPQSSIYSDTCQSSYNDNRPATIFAKRPSPGDLTTWQGGIDTAFLRPAQPGTQSFILQNISLVGWASIDFNNLSNAEAIKVHGIDVQGCKDTVKIIDVSFKFLEKAIYSSNDETTYTDSVMLDNVHVIRCYQAIDCLPTVGVIINGLYIFDCFKWVNTSRLAGDGLVCNNSSFATERTQIVAESMAINGVWIEGGNNVIRCVSAVFNGGYISETFSATGATKFVVDVRYSGLEAVNQSITFNGVRMPTNTRLINGGATTQNYRKLSLVLNGCQNVGGSFGASTDIYGYVARGLKFSGISNALRDAETTDKWNQTYNVNTRGTELNRISSSKATATGIIIPVEFDPAFLSSQNATTQPEVIKFIYAGHNDGTGGAATYTAEITLIKGMGNVWSAKSSDTAVATVSLNPFSTGTGTNITIIPVHEGNKNNGAVWVSFCSANLNPTMPSIF